MRLFGMPLQLFALFCYVRNLYYLAPSDTAGSVTYLSTMAWNCGY